MTDTVIVALIGVAGVVCSGAITASVPRIFDLLQDRRAHKAQVELEQLKHAQLLESQNAEHRRQRSAQRLDELRSVYSKFMQNVRELEAQAIAAGKIPPQGVEFETAASNVTTAIEHYKTQITNQLYQLEPDPGATDVVNAYDKLVTALSQLMVAVYSARDHGPQFSDRRQMVENVREQVAKVHEAVLAHMQRLESGS